MYIDDFLAVADDPMLVYTLHKQLSSVYAIKVLSTPHKYLECEVQHEHGGSVRINQEMEIDQIISAANMKY